MYAVGRLSSYITRGVSTVSGPFHPFGGAIDIVVVQQQDGSLKSSPWYVRFGKFQGVLKAKERVVDINVNGVEADFHMYLNPRGEAYFLREVVGSEEIDAVSLQSCETDTKGRCLRPTKSKSMDYNFDHCNSLMDVSNAHAFSRNLGFVLERKSRKDANLTIKDDTSIVGRTSADSAEIAADLLEMKWSTSLSTKPNDKSQRECNKDDGESASGKLEASIVLHEEHFVNRVDDNDRNADVVKKVDEVIIANVDDDGIISVYEGPGGSMETNNSNEEKNLKVESDGSTSNGLDTVEEHIKVADGPCTEVSCVRQENVSEDVQSCSVVAVSVSQAKDDKCRLGADETNEVKTTSDSNGQLQDGSSDSLLMKEEQFVFSDLVDKNPTVDHESTSLNHGLDSSPCTFDQESIKNDIEGLKGNIRRYRSDTDLAKSCELPKEEVRTQAKSLPNLWSQFDEFDPNKLHDSTYYTLDPKQRFSKWDALRNDASRIIKEGDKQSAIAKTKDRKGDASNIGNDNGKSWSIWPFTGRSRSRRLSQKEHYCKKDLDFDTVSEVDGEKDPLSKSNKMRKEVTPTPEQLQSLNLTEGKNTVTFTFSTAVLGNQQVDARIFLWRWDTRIVISDVDGTITKSDVLGQFMPLVGKDWTHIGVTHLFSAIKENGYEILFLSARSISQADITRQFLINLKQDGKTLPEGPVVISPDGLFPSLFREVIRRAPHEFKIACLEDIRACFPADWNPFYAGFGNRDTDEFSYLKVGIAKGKIFIINPKGEVVVNRCTDTKSYSSLHSVVNGIFPPISEHEEVETH